jgi:uncharacterized protein
MHRSDLNRIFGAHPFIIGMVHLPPLPGAPGHAGMDDVLERARADAHALAAGGVHGIMVENFGDTPFLPGTVPPETIAAMTLAVSAIARETALPLGINVLRNDARAALGIAAATGARFMRVNVHTGAMLTDQGWIAGHAHETLRARASLRVPVAIFADVMVKHALAPPGLRLESAARDTWDRGGADALIVSGSATGDAIEPDDLRSARRVVPAAPLLIGSGLGVDNAPRLLPLADGAIVGSAFQRDGRAGAPVEAERVRAVMATVAAVSG